MSKEKLFFFDLETTGVKHWENGIHQISGMIVINGVVREKFNFKVKPFTDDVIEDEALKVGGVTRDVIDKYETQWEVKKQLTAILQKYVDKYDRYDKMHLVGYNNSSFDNQFLRAFFTKCGDKYFGSMFFSDSIDVMVLASNFFRKVRKELVNFKLHTVARALGIQVDDTKLHDAEYDIEITYQMFKKLNNLE